MQYACPEGRYTLRTDVREDDRIRQSFNALAEQVFGLSFEEWYQDGYWGDGYRPYALLDGERVVANVSVSRIDTVWQGEKKRCHQIGTVMCEAGYRNRGLCRWLLNRVLAERKDCRDMIYLYANDSVLEFYPKFGFVRAEEFQCELPVSPKPGGVRRLDLSSPIDRALLLDRYALSNPYSALPNLGNPGLLMFYCTQSLKECVYYLEADNAVAVVAYDGDRMLCYDLFCDGGAGLEELLSAFAEPHTRVATLGFTPKEASRFVASPYREDDLTLFVLAGKENLFAGHQLMFPLLSHA